MLKACLIRSLCEHLQLCGRGIILVNHGGQDETGVTELEPITGTRTEKCGGTWNAFYIFGSRYLVNAANPELPMALRSASISATSPHCWWKTHETHTKKPTVMHTPFFTPTSHQFYSSFKGYPFGEKKAFILRGKTTCFNMPTFWRTFGMVKPPVPIASLRTLAFSMILRQSI